MRQLQIDNYTIDTPLMDIIRKLQLTLTNGKLREASIKGHDIVVTCPHHSDGLEKEAACRIYIGEEADKEYGVVNCFVCGFKGPFYHFVAECFNSSDEFAKKWLINNYGKLAYEAISWGEDIGAVKTKATRYLDEKMLDKYQTWCPYMSKRKLSRATCEKFKLRYDSLNRQIIFPVFDTKGRLIMLPTRAIDSKVFYIPTGVEKPVYCLDKVISEGHRSIIVTEGLFDCLTAWEYGMPAVATLGMPADTQFAQINRADIDIVYAMFDNDSAGRKFTAMLRKNLRKSIIFVDVRINIPGRKDINDLSREEFQKIIKSYQN